MAASRDLVVKYRGLIRNQQGGRKKGVTLFRERMQREGKGAEWRHRYNTIVRPAKTGSRSYLVNELAKDMGFKSIEDEKRLLKLHIFGTENPDIDEEEDCFEEAISRLPNYSSPVKEMRWVKAHPATTRMIREGVKKVELTAEDILAAPCGIAPSKAAVNMLQFWANNPKDFFRLVLGKTADQANAVGREQAKRKIRKLDDTKEGNSSSTSGRNAVRDIERMLAAANGESEDDG